MLHAAAVGLFSARRSRGRERVPSYAVELVAAPRPIPDQEAAPRRSRLRRAISRLHQAAPGQAPPSRPKPEPKPPPEPEKKEARRRPERRNRRCRENPSTGTRRGFGEDPGSSILIRSIARNIVSQVYSSTWSPGSGQPAGRGELPEFCGTAACAKSGSPGPPATSLRPRRRGRRRSRCGNAPASSWSPAPTDTVGPVLPAASLLYARPRWRLLTLALLAATGPRDRSARAGGRGHHWVERRPGRDQLHPGAGPGLVVDSGSRPRLGSGIVRRDLDFSDRFEISRGERPRPDAGTAGPAARSTRAL